jgi:alkylhydroperoxidase family enzyme
MKQQKRELKPIQEPFPPEVARAFERYPKAADGYILQLFRVFANSRRFLTGKGALNLLDRESPLSLRERELVILRVTANANCEYEWGVHVSAFAAAARLSSEQVAATRGAPCDATCWSEREALLLTCIDQLCDNARIDEPEYVRFQETWTLEQQLEILALAGNYQLVSYVANTTRLAPEPGAARFPVAGVVERSGEKQLI